MEKTACVIAGAGVVGLAIAREMAMRGFETLVLEAEHMIGTQTSSRNSEVIHAGIYYEPDSLKARFCVEGKERLYAYAQAQGIPYKRCGKLIVATSEAQHSALDKIIARAEACGVHDLQRLSAAEAQALEPSIRCTAALFSPSTGIIDSHALMLSLQGDAENHGAAIAFNTEILCVEQIDGGFSITTRDRESGEEFTLEAERFINAAGLGAQAIAATIDGLAPEHIPALHLAKGNYFSASGKNPFSHLIYPVPVDGGLGVHLTLDLNGQMRFGPDVEWLEHVAPQTGLDYSVDPQRGDSFYAAIRQYWPELPDGVLQATYSGIRPKLSSSGETAADFRISGSDDHGITGLINLFGIESPGLTSSLAIAAHVSTLIK
ncbi:NAD(P)/FAD-dependent oxidoreductase [Pseudochrobactrum algeriensis]|uniref:NAD(P)/FAD-dependent oxidoreductase n=1 Tax=Pseudochrobactrum algeriensis TaxID=2834768 RepID=UPI001BCDC656|nr:NAD(P)/FAD-dependent oxidoreductase [Pseudochrobactrum algeriensis]MBX8813114.1 NAD(P)/FAD-dependent oxidoreductase [Ochrobactrum sp. MR34]QVQ37042.1 NAD(P)/FAD-dependent oxidoreductase [Pseudochrobactrum algeriensis]QVQ40258.1 NAD(P)/FAD-dependent oxidoreductase [Pseudochrobactrum algeriensis]QVQ44181.1 NAD(P)/FAD-dependent oxidoreductase [Pseudochrobactrum algeriensis]